MNVKNIVQKVWYKKKSKQKLVTIPKKCNIKPGDYVIIQKLEVKDV